MKLLLFAVFDSATKLFLPPFECRTIEEAVRRFRATVNHPDAGNIGQFPEDYTLFHLGEFDQQSGEMVSLPTPHSLGIAVTFVERMSHVRIADSPADAHHAVAEKDLREVNHA